MPTSQLNRFFRGHNDFSSSNLLAILNELEIDLIKIINEKLKEKTSIESTAVTSKNECLEYLFNSLDEIGQQTYLNTLAWASRLANKKKFPNEIELFLKHDTSTR
jgi:hypothetical protein